MPIYNVLEQGTEIMYPSKIWPVRVQKKCTSPHKQHWASLPWISAYLQLFGAWYKHFVPVYNFTSQGTKKLYFTAYKNIGHLNHKYVLIYNFLEPGRRFCYVSGYIIIGVLIESLCLLILQLTLLKKHLDFFFSSINSFESSIFN